MRSKSNPRKQHFALSGRSRMICRLAALGSALTSSRVMAASQTWTGGGGDGLWTTGTNWLGGAAPGGINPAPAGVSQDVATFNGPVGAVSPIIFDNLRNVASIVFDTANAGAYIIQHPSWDPNNPNSSLSGDGLILTTSTATNGNITLNSTVVNAQVFNTPILFLPANSQNSVYSFVNNATDSNATLTFNGTLINRSGNTRPLTLTLGGSNTGNNTIHEIYGADFLAAARGSIVLNKTGTGTWILTGANPSWIQKTSNAVPAGVQVNDGTLVLKDGGGLGTLTQPNIRAQGTGTLRLDGIALANNGVTLNATGRLLANGSSSINALAMATTATDVRLETANAADVLTVNGPVSAGSATSVLHVAGPGQVVVSGTGTFLGAWSFDSGTTTLNSGDALGPTSRVSFGAGSTARLQLNGFSSTTSGLSTNATLGTPIVENGVSTATLTVNNSVAQTFAGLMQDGAAPSTLALTKSGVGALVLTGANTYTGGTNVTNGTLFANNLNGSATGFGAVIVSGAGILSGNGTISGPVAIGAGATIAPGAAASSVGTLSVRALALGAGSKLNYDIASSSSLDLILVNNNGNGLSIDGGQLSINGGVSAFTTNGVYNLIGYNGVIGGAGLSALTMHPNSQNLATNTYTFGAANGFVTLTVASSGGAITYWNADANGNWSSGPWTTPTPNAAGAFASFGGGGTAITANRTITVDGAYTVGTLAFNNPSFNYTLAAGTGAHIILDNNAAPSFITNAAGTHTVEAPLTMTSGATVTITNAGDTLSINGKIDGPGPLNKNGAGTLVLGGDNTYTGGTIVNAGTVVIKSAASLGDSGGSLTFAGGAIKLIGDVTDSRNYELKDLADVVIDANGQTLTHSGTIFPQAGATGGLIKNGGGTLVLQGGNGYFGPTTINGGTLSISSNNNLGDIASGAALTLNGGATLIATASLDLDNNGANARPVTINGNTTFDVADGSILTVRGVVDGNGTLTKTGNGNLILTQANTYPGGATLKGGTLTAGNGQALGPAGNLIMSDATRFHFQGGGNTFIGYPIFIDSIPTGATITFSSSNAANAYFGPITGAATDTISISGIGGAQVSFSGGANLQQFANFPGLVRIESDGSLRFSATTQLNNGGLNTTFEVLGNMQGRNNGTVNLGELKGTGQLVGSTAVDNNTTTFSIGGKGTDSTFDGTIIDNNTSTGRRAAVTKVGAGKLTLTGNNLYTGPTTIMAGTLVLGPLAQEPIFGGPTVTTPAFADIRAGMLALQYADEASGGALVANVSSTLDAGYDQVPQFSQGSLRSVGIAPGRVMGWLNDTAGSQVLVRPTVIGDLNLDGSVTISDFIDLAAHFNATGATWADGDLNYDQAVTISDFIDLAANFGTSFSGEVFPISTGDQQMLNNFYAANVPEPAALGFLLAVALLPCRRRRSTM